MELPQPLVLRVRGMLLLTSLVLSGTSLALAASSFIGPLSNVTTLSTTVPSNGDVNPYGVAQVPVTRGNLVSGNFLISNFNNSDNVQGTGTTIVQISPSGAFSLFAQIDPDHVPCPGGIGLTTALVALRSGFVIVGSLPTIDGNISGSGCLIVLNAWGKVVETITGNHLNGPWDMTAVDDGSLVTLFVTNVLNGTVAAGGNPVNGGTVVRLLLSDIGERPQVLRAPSSAPASPRPPIPQRSSSAPPASPLTPAPAPSTSPTASTIASRPSPTRSSASSAPAPASQSPRVEH